MPRIFRKKKIFWDLVCLAFFTIIVFYVASKYDVLERLVNFTRLHEEWELDELISTAAFLSFAIAVFALRRWKESRDLFKILDVRNKTLETALKEIDYLKGILPICSGCKKIRDHKGDWQPVETYVENHSKARFSHSMCPDCLEVYYGDEPWYKTKKNLPDPDR